MRWGAGPKGPRVFDTAFCIRNTYNGRVLTLRIWNGSEGSEPFLFVNPGSPPETRLRIP